MINTLYYHPLTIPDVANHSVRTHESCCFENQALILAHPFELDKNQNFENHIDILASHPFPEIELEHEYDPEPQLDNLISLLDSIMT